MTEQPTDEAEAPPLDRNIETSLDDHVDEVTPPDIDELADFLADVAKEEGIKDRKGAPKDGRSDEAVPDDSTDSEVH